MNGINLTDETKDRLIFWLIGALVGSGVGGGLGVFRIDKFTGTEGRELTSRVSLNEEDFDKRIFILESYRCNDRLDIIEDRIAKLPPEKLRNDVFRNGLKLDELEKKLEHISNENFWIIDRMKKHE